MQRTGSHNNSNGFTLIEAVISLAAFMIVTLGAISLNSYASAATERIRVRAELLENARIAVDVMSVYIKAADIICVRVDNEGNMLDILMDLTLDNRRTEPEFTFRPRADPGTAAYQRLSFGGNELASNIAQITAKRKGDILTLSVTTADRVSGSAITAEPVKLTTKIKIYNPFSLSLNPCRRPLGAGGS